MRIKAEALLTKGERLVNLMQSGIHLLKSKSENSIVLPATLRVIFRVFGIALNIVAEMAAKRRRGQAYRKII